MHKVRKPISVSLKRIIHKRSESVIRDFRLVVCTKAIKVFDSRTRVYLGNIYFTGGAFYFSRQLLNTLVKEYGGWFDIQSDICKFLSLCMYDNWDVNGVC